MSKRCYPSDLTEEQWRWVEPLLPAERPGGRHRSVDMRAVLDGILYLVRSGCAWRSLPHDLPPWGTVHFYYRRFRIEGVWASIHDRLRPVVRARSGREASTLIAVIDTQSIKTTEKGGLEAMTRVKRSRAANATSLLTRSGCC